MARSAHQDLNKIIMAVSFASDNNSGVHPAIIGALSKANSGNAIGYGDDEITKLAEEKIKQLFGCDLDVYFVFTGTAANVYRWPLSAGLFIL